MDDQNHSLPVEDESSTIHVVAGTLDDSGLEPHFPSSKSMDNMESIILENPIDDDEDTSASVDFLDSIAEEDQSSHEQDSPEPLINKPLIDIKNSSTPMKQGSSNSLSQYFMAESDNSGGDFFDTLTPKVAEDLPEKFPEENAVGDSAKTVPTTHQLGGDVITDKRTENLVTSSDNVKPAPMTDLHHQQESGTGNGRLASDTKEVEMTNQLTDDTENQIDCYQIKEQTSNSEKSGKKAEFEIETVDIQLDEGDNALRANLDTDRIRTTSCSEEIPVAFEESKGEGLRLAPSTKSLCKFFSEDGGGQDTEGKSFFDTFTAAEGEEEPGDQAPSSLPPDTGEKTRNSASDTSLPPPETPPIIPGTSPFNSQPPTPLSSSTSQQPPLPLVTQDSAPNDTISVPFDSDEDAFSQSLKISDENRRYDVWIPSETSRQVFIAMATSQPGHYVPSPEHLTMPGIIIDEPQGDPVKDLVKKFRGEQEASLRQTLGVSGVPQNEDGLRQLITSECYRAAVDLTGVLLTQCGQGNNSINTPTKHSPYSLQLWLVRMSLLMKLRLYSHAESECQAFGALDKPDLYYQFYPDIYPGRKGSMVPFKLRLLHSELPLYLGKTQESLDRLYYLQAIVVKILCNLESGLAEDGSSVHISDSSRKTSRELWESREIQLMYSIGNCLLNIKDYTTALDVYESLLKKDIDNKAALLCGIGRIYLQMGDIKQAQNMFNKAEIITKDSNINYVKSRNLMNKGFLALGQNQFTDAQQYFKDAVDIDPENGVAVNNMAVTSLYTGKLKEALTTLENLIHSNPTKYLQEGLLFNLCTLYELESSQALLKKQKLLDLVSRHKGNGFNVACLKMA